VLASLARLAAVGLLQIGYSDANLAAWVPLNAIISIVGWFYWMLHCSECTTTYDWRLVLTPPSPTALTNVKYKHLNDFCCLKMYTSAQQARVGQHDDDKELGDVEEGATPSKSLMHKQNLQTFGQHFKFQQLQAIRGLDKDVATLMGIPLSTRFVGQLTVEVVVVIILAFNLLSSKLSNVGLTML
jgi:hypothetical protein